MDSIDYYNKYAAAYYESTVDLDMSEALERFVKYLPENAEVLDLMRIGKGLFVSGGSRLLRNRGRRIGRNVQAGGDQSW